MVKYIFIAISISCALFCFFQAYMAWRAHKVWRFVYFDDRACKMTIEDLQNMMRRYWIWPLDKFLDTK